MKWVFRFFNATQFNLRFFPYLYEKLYICGTILNIRIKFGENFKNFKFKNFKKTLKIIDKGG